VRRLLALGLVALTLAGCGGPILANDPLDFPAPASPTDGPPHRADPIAIAFPRDDGPHERLTEWWYYTGHLRTETGRRFGFEAVIFRAERSSVPVAWASHLALTDERGNAFHYGQRSEIGPQVDRSPRDAAGSPTGFDLQVGGPGAASPWQLSGGNGVDRIEAALAPQEAAVAGAQFGLTLDLEALKEPALHDRDGFVDFGPAGSSYYYSRTRMEASGALTLDGEELQVEGIAWFDHQWGDFVSVGGGGWDWFAVNLDDGTDLTFSVVRDAALEVVVQYGTVVTAAGGVIPIPAEAFRVDRSRLGVEDWTSPATGLTWPAGWTIPYEAEDGLLLIDLRPTVAAQELDTRPTTGVVYWEGSQIVDARRTLPGANAFQTLGGEAYVEITRYGN
jgi:predicted secreted hydrolase